MVQVKPKPLINKKHKIKGVNFPRVFFYIYLRKMIGQISSALKSKDDKPNIFAIKGSQSSSLQASKTIMPQREENKYDSSFAHKNIPKDKN
jgi:hypothetical protein